jgi:1-acyl-sn-glycerol-3-phosphate acyltransferase
MFSYYLVMLIIIVLTILFGSFSLVSSLFDRKGKLQHLCARYWGRSILKLTGIHTEISGLQNLSAANPVILMSNHQSLYDILVLLSSLPLQFAFLAKESLFKIPILGWHMSRAGYIPIDRGNSRDGVRSLLEGVKKIQAGTSVVIFPEGTRSLDSKVALFRMGGFVMAIKSGVPIIPITINGTGKVVKKGGKKFSPHKIKVIIDSPIETKNYSVKEKESLAEKVRQVIVKNWHAELNL